MALVDLFYASLVLVLGLLDLYWVVVRTPSSARGIRAYGWRLSGGPFAVGMLFSRALDLGFGPTGESYGVVVGATAGLFALVVLLHWFLQRWVDLPSWFGLLYVPCGVIPGLYLWPM